jgi:hypothetical protein
MEQAQVKKSPTLVEIVASIEAMTATLATIGARIDALEQASKPVAKSDKDMTDDDARSVLNGETKDMKHNDAAKKLGLSYGQVYSARLGYTFKHIHKELAAVAGYKNRWMKA